MPLPQLSLDLIGRHRVTGYRAMSDGFRNSVWHVVTKDNSQFFVKKCPSQWAWKNEVRANRHLKHQGIPAPNIYAAYSDTIIFSDVGLRAPVIPNEATFRGAGRLLRRLHDGTPLPPEAQSTDAGTLALTVQRRAIENGYVPSCLVPTHGDVHPDNMVTLMDGRLVHFIDFEEYWTGDALVDLLIGLVECCRFEPKRMPLVASWMLGAYFAWDVSEQRLTKWRNLGQRKILVNACFDGLLDWAKLDRNPEEHIDLTEKREAITTCLLSDATIN